VVGAIFADYREGEERPGRVGMREGSEMYRNGQIESLARRRET